MSKVTSIEPRGIRNHNPGNIRSNENYVWRHQSNVDTDGFCVFSAPEWGIRAMAIILSHYVEYDGVITLAQLIERWAPADDNNTDAYVNAVVGWTGIPANDNLVLRDEAQPIITAMIKQENGVCPYSIRTIRNGIMFSHQW